MKEIRLPTDLFFLGTCHSLNKKFCVFLQQNMSRKVFYRYNPESGHYERVFPSRRERVWNVIQKTLLSVISCCAVGYIIYIFVDTPREKQLQQENRELKTHLDLLSRRLDASLDVIDDISARDNNFYRVIMGAERVSASSRFSGLDNENRYNYLNGLTDAAIIKNLTRKMDLLDRSLYNQILSFDELQRMARNNKDRLSHIPSIQPISRENMKQMASGYGYRRDPIYGTSRFHAGLDFAADRGTKVYATADGTVTESGWESGYGNCIDINHGFGYITRYAHLNRCLVKKGQQVKRGDLIGEVGSTGKSTGSHLHYEVRLNGVPQNPINYYFMDITAEEYDDLVRQAENAGHVMD